MANTTSKKQRNNVKQSKNYYENDKERLIEQARNKYRNLSEEDKRAKRRKEAGIKRISKTKISRSKGV